MNHAPPRKLWLTASTLLLATLCCSAATAQTTRPSVWMAPPAFDHGRLFRELFEHPDQWRETRSLIDVLFYTDLNFQRQFSDQELQQWFGQMKDWQLKVGLETGAIKPWGQTGSKTFSLEHPMWERIERLGGNIAGIAMDEPLCCCRKDLHQPDAYAVEQTADYISQVRDAYPQMLVGDIEPYPFIPLADQMAWIDSLQKRLLEEHIRGLDFFRLDVDWTQFIVNDRGSWPEVHKLEQFCRSRKIPFSLIYWAAVCPALEHRKLADISTWYTGVLRQGDDYALVGGRPDQVVIESWLSDAPASCVPESQDFTFTRSVRDFCRKFVK
jgi:hypothetical protein